MGEWRVTDADDGAPLGTIRLGEKPKKTEVIAALAKLRGPAVARRLVIDLSGPAILVDNRDGDPVYTLILND